MPGHFLGNDVVIGQPIARGRVEFNKWRVERASILRLSFKTGFGLANMAQIFGKSSNSIARVTLLAAFFGFFGFWRIVYAVPLSWLDFAAPFGVGCLWLSAFLSRLKAVPLLPQNDPGMQFAFVYQHAP